MRALSIGKLARAAKVSIDTIRYYEKSGLLRAPARRPSGFREYSELDLRQLKLIRSARLLGFSLEEIAQLLALDNVRAADAARGLIQRKLATIDQKLYELQRWRSCLLELGRAAPGHATEKNFILDCFESAAAGSGDCAAVEHSLQEPPREVHEET